MRRYSHLLTLARSRCLSISAKRWVQKTSPNNSRHLRPPPPPSPPPFSHPRSPSHQCGKMGIGTFPSNLLLSHHYSGLSTLRTPELSSDSEDMDDSRPDYAVVVKGRDVVSATHAAANAFWLPLSNLDLLLPPLEAGVFFCYKRKDNGMSPEAAVETVKTALAGVLSTFFPLAGEIVRNRQGEAEVLCNNRGVEFVHAHADVELRTLDLHHPDDSVKGKLVPRIKHGVLSVQVTEFNCGAIVISCAFDHRVADAHSLNMFLVAWAESARSKPLSILPSFRSSTLNPRHPTHFDTALDKLYIPVSSLPPQTSHNDPFSSRIYYIHSEAIQRIQRESSSKESKPSKLKSFTAFLWKLFAQGNNNSDADKTSRMGVIVNGRRFLTPDSDEKSSSFETHFGNVLSIPYGEVNVRDLKAMPLNKIAEKVCGFVGDATKEEHFRSLVDWVELHRPEPVAAKIYLNVKEAEGEAVVVSSGQGLPANDLDFGWGKPEFVSYHFPWGDQTGYIVTMPSVRKNGDWVVYLHLKQNQLDLIESKAAHVFKPITQSYLNF